MDHARERPHAQHDLVRALALALDGAAARELDALAPGGA